MLQLENAAFSGSLQMLLNRVGTRRRGSGGGGAFLRRFVPHCSELPFDVEKKVRTRRALLPLRRLPHRGDDGFVVGRAINVPFIKQAERHSAEPFLLLETVAFLARRCITRLEIAYSSRKREKGVQSADSE